MAVVKFLLNHWDALVGAATTIIAAILALVSLIKNKKWGTLLSHIKEVMGQADTFVNYTGEEKKAYVLMQVQVFAKSKHIRFNKDKVSAAIEEFITLTKSVNKREKDKK